MYFLKKQAQLLLFFLFLNFSYFSYLLSSSSGLAIPQLPGFPVAQSKATPYPPSSFQDSFQEGDDSSDLGMGDQLKALLGTEEGRREMKEQFKMIAEWSGEADVESFAEKMMQESLEIATNDNKLNEFNSAAQEMQKEMETAMTDPAFAKMLDDEMESELKTEAKNQVEADKQEGSGAKDFEEKTADDLTKKRTIKQKKEVKTDVSLSWQEGILQNYESGKLAFSFKNYFQSGAQSILRSLSSLGVSIAAMDDFSLKQTLHDEKFSDFSSRISEFFGHFASHNIYLKAFYNKENKPLREALVSLDRDLKILKNQFSEAAESFEKRIDEQVSQGRFLQQDRSEEEKVFANKQRVSAEGLFKKLGQFLTDHRPIQKKFEALGNSPEVAASVKKKKEQIKLAALLAASKNLSTLDKIKDNFERDTWGGGGSPYGRSRDYGPSSYDSSSYPGHNNPYLHHPYYSNDNKPSEEDGSDAGRQLSEKKQDSLEAELQAFLGCASFSQLLSLNLEKIDEAFYKKVSEVFLAIDAERLFSKMDDLNKKLSSGSEPLDQAAAEGKEKQQSSNHKVNQKLQQQFVSGMKSIQRGLVLLKQHPVIVPIPGDEKETSSVHVLPLAVELLRDVSYFYQMVSKSQSENNLQALLQSLAKHSEEIKKKQEVFMQMNSLVVDLVGGSVEESAGQQKLTAEKALELAKKDFSKVAFDQKIKSACDLVTGSITQLKTAIENKKQNVESLKEPVKNAKKQLNKLVMASVDFLYKVPVLDFVDDVSGHKQIVNDTVKGLIVSLQSQIDALSNDETSEKQGLFEAIAEAFFSLVEDVAELFSGVDDFDSDDLVDGYKSIVHSGNVLTSLWRLDATRSATQQGGGWDGFMKSLADPFSLAQLKKSTEFKDPKKRSQMWEESSPAVKAKIPDFIASWCQGQKDGLDKETFSVTKAARNLKFNLSLPQAAVLGAQEVLQNIEMAKVLALQDLYQASPAYSPEEQQFLGAKIRQTKKRVLKSCLAFLQQEKGPAVGSKKPDRFQYENSLFEGQKKVQAFLSFAPSSGSEKFSGFVKTQAAEFKRLWGSDDVMVKLFSDMSAVSDGESSTSGVDEKKLEKYVVWPEELLLAVNLSCRYKGTGLENEKGSVAKQKNFVESRLAIVWHLFLKTMSEMLDPSAKALSRELRALSTEKLVDLSMENINEGPQTKCFELFNLLRLGLIAKCVKGNDDQLWTAASGVGSWNDLLAGDSSNLSGKTQKELIFCQSVSSSQGQQDDGLLGLLSVFLPVTGSSFVTKGDNLVEWRKFGLAVMLSQQNPRFGRSPETSLENVLNFNFRKGLLLEALVGLESVQKAYQQSNGTTPATPSADGPSTQRAGLALENALTTLLSSKQPLSAALGLSQAKMDDSSQKILEMFSVALDPSKTFSTVESDYAGIDGKSLTKEFSSGFDGESARKGLAILQALYS